MMRNTFLLAALLVVTAFCMLSFTTPAGEEPQQVSYYQTTIAGSVGSVDEKDATEVDFSRNRARIKNNLDNARIVLRYDVQLNLMNNVDFCDNMSLYLRYKDNGPKAEIIAKFKSYDVFNGATDTYLVFNSDNFSQADGFQIKWVTESGANIIKLDPALAYYVEVTITKRGAAGTPELGGLVVLVGPI